MNHVEYKTAGPPDSDLCDASDMRQFRFALIISVPPMSNEEILDITDALGEVGCTDASIRGHAEGMELLFERAARSLEAAISSAVTDVESTGQRVLRVEMERQAFASV